MNPLNLRKQLLDNSSDLQEFSNDLKAWGAEMKRKEEVIKDNSGVEKPVKELRNKKPKKKEQKLDDSKKIEEPVKTSLQKDYDYWQKFDADKECEKVDKTKHGSDSEELSDEIDEEMMDLASEEKEKGNKFFKNNSFENAIKHYTKAIELYAYEPSFYCNRALCHLKLENNKSAESDCTTALQIDQTYVKALHRRAQAREAMGQYVEAKSDLNKLFELDSNNKASKDLLKKVERKLDMIGQGGPIIDTQRPLSKFNMSRNNLTGSALDKQTPSTSKIHGEAIKNKVIERKEPKIKIVDEIVKAVPIINKCDDKPKIDKATITEIIDEPSIDKKASITEIIDKPLIEAAKITQKQTVEKVKKASDEIKWPCEENVIIIKAINKTPNQRSKEHLKRMQIYDVNLKSEKQILQTKKDVELVTKEITQDVKLKAQVLNIKEDTDKPESENIYIKSAESEFEDKFDLINCNVDLSTEDFSELNLAVPTTSVQFYLNWRSLKNDKKLRFLYLRQINPTIYSHIFKDSLETKVFSEIIEILSEVFIEKNLDVFPYLYCLTKVKRFSTMAMFKTSKDKQALLSMIAYMYMNMKEYNRSEELIDYLNTKYEL